MEQSIFAQPNYSRRHDTQHDGTWHSNTQHYDTQHSNTQHNGAQHSNTQHNNKNVTLCITVLSVLTLNAECHYDKCLYAQCRGVKSSTTEGATEKLLYGIIETVISVTPAKKT